MVFPVDAVINIQSVPLHHFAAALRQPNAENPLQCFKNIPDFTIKMINQPLSPFDPRYIIQAAVRFRRHAYIADTLRRVRNCRIIKKTLRQDSVLP